MARKLVVLLSLALVLTGCWPGAETPVPTPTPTSESVAEAPTPTPMPSPSATPEAGVEAKYAVGKAVREVQAFAEYVPYRVEVVPTVAKYDFALEELASPELAEELSPAARKKLTENGFAVVEAAFWQIYEPYQNAKDRGIPIFVTTDALLHTYHILYDYTLRSVEMEHLIADLEALTGAMLASSQAQYRESQGVVKEAAHRNVAFFSVAAKLLDPEAAIPQEVKKLVEAELELIKAHQGFAQSPIFGYREDYSQYVPRGHYTRNESFQRYFKAMIWYGRMPFRLRPGETPEAIAKGRQETRQAILIVAALENIQTKAGPALKVWDRIYQPTVFFVGRTDDLNLYDYSEVLGQVFGEELSLEALTSEEKLDSVIEIALSLRPPKIVSTEVGDEEDPQLVTKGFRFMGQRFIPDSYMFQQLVYDQVGTRDKPRLFPKGLDVLAVLDSERAYEILTEIYGQNKYQNYEAQMAKLREEFGELPPEQWTENLYWNWLHSLRPLLEPKGEGYPAFMQSQAWQDKELHTALGSWTELRHDTILYAKQSYTIKAVAILPPEEPPKGYVEPNPEVYARLASLARQTRTGLEARGMLSGEYAEKLERLEVLLLQLKTMAEKELKGEALSDQEQDTIRNIGSTLEHLTTFASPEAKKVTSEADERMAVVADVHTDPNTGQVLEEGVGDAFLIYAIVPIEGEATLSQGAVFSYYEFLQPMAERLTDEAWQELCRTAKVPVWTESFLAREAG